MQFYAFSEGMLLIQKAGVDMKKAIEIIQQSAIASPNIQQRAPIYSYTTEKYLYLALN